MGAGVDSSTETLLPGGEPAGSGGSHPSRARSIGVVGGGQLAWMLAGAAENLGVELHVQTPSPQDPAVRLARGVVQAPLDEISATAELARHCDAISFENEWIPLQELRSLEAEGVCFLPSLDALAPLVDKRTQRQLLNGLHLPSPRWCPLEAVLAPAVEESPDGAAAGHRGAAEGGAASDPVLPPAPQLPRLPDGLHFPVMAKAVRGGYDGKGTRPLRRQEDLEALLAEGDPAGWMLEEMVAFERELALVACRDRDGTVVCFPLVETHQHQQVCDWVLFPAAVGHAVEALARNVAASLLTNLDYVGVLSIEFFYGRGGLLVNELAPRTHNSGHLTIEACRCSQFEQQVRIVAGLPLGSTDPLVPGALMVNLLGLGDPPLEQERRRQTLEALPGAHLHWYGKQGTTPGRKLGHLTRELHGATASERQEEARILLAAIRAIWPLPLQSNTAPFPLE